MTNTIVLLSVLLTTNWQDTAMQHDGYQIQVGRVQTNYVVAPASDFKREEVRRLLPTPALTNEMSVVQFGKTYPILTSQPFFGPYNLVREVPDWWVNATNYWIVTNVSDLTITNFWKGTK